MSLVGWGLTQAQGRAHHPLGRPSRAALARKSLGTRALGLPQHPLEHRPERPILLTVDQQFGEGACLGFPQYAPIASARSACDLWRARARNRKNTAGNRRRSGSFRAVALFNEDGNAASIRATWADT